MIERFDWTDHAKKRAREREFDRFDVEMTIVLGHDGREESDGRADWRVRGVRLDGEVFEVIYDHPSGVDLGRVRIVSIWLRDEEGSLS